jgi:hypothetical protein
MMIKSEKDEMGAAYTSIVHDRERNTYTVLKGKSEIKETLRSVVFNIFILYALYVISH